MTLLEIKDLKITYETEDSSVHAVNNVSLSMDAGINYGLVGESGCGKSTLALAVLGLLDDNARIERGEIRFKGQNLLELSDKEYQQLRWEEIAYIPQSAMDSLDPVMSVGAQIVQAIRKHRDVSKSQARDRTKEVFEMVGLEIDRIDDYPHQFSGGMRQRVTIAMALALEPDLIIADEPTTGLDVIVQDKIIDKMLEIQEEVDSSLLLITHEIGVVAETSDEISVLYGGKVMEQGPTDDVLTAPSNPYTMGLKNSFPDIEKLDEYAVTIPGSSPVLDGDPSSCVFASRCPFATEACQESHPDLTAVNGSYSACHHVDRAKEMRTAAADPETWGLLVEDRSASREAGETILETHNLSKWYEQSQPLLDQLRGNEPSYVKAVQDVSLEIRESEILGIAGESGCGKSTLAETLAVLNSRTDGDIMFKGRPVDEYLDEGTKEFRSKLQFIFQDPFDSLNPRQTVRGIVSEPLKIQDWPSDRIVDQVKQTLKDVGLNPPEQYLDNYPHQLSGGERQRVAIARALVVEPEILICDEPASMLDVSLKASILNILRRLADERNLGVMYISHDLASLTQIADKLAIMYLGRIVEQGPTRQVISNPKHPYVVSLLSASPKTDPRIDRTRVLLPGEPPSPVDLPGGCNFAPRCPKATDECLTAEPDLEAADDTGHRVACYFPVENINKEILAKYR